MKINFRIVTIIIGVLLVSSFINLNDTNAQTKNNKMAEMIEARQKFFGEENVNSNTGEIKKDKVILSWFGVSNFAAVINGHVILLDAWVPRGIYSGYVPTTVDELAALQPEAIFIGHAHFDHAADAGEIIRQSGTTKLIGTPEHCEFVKKQLKDDEDLSCIYAAPENAEPSTVTNINNLLDGVEIKAITHIHSGLVKPDKSEPHEKIYFNPDLSVIAKNPPKAKDFSHLLKSVLADEEGGSILYQFTIGEFTLTWNDSAGPIKEEAPNLMKVMKNLPKTDVQVGAIMGFNQFTNGLRDPMMYMNSLQPRVFVPTHHDNWLPPISSNASHYRKYLEKEFANIPVKKRPQLLFIQDPDDYVNPRKLTFSIKDRRWR